MKDTNRTSKLSQVHHWIWLIGTGVFLFLVYKHGIRQIPPIYIILYLVLGWIVDLLESARENVRIVREERGGSPRKLTRSILIFLAPLLLKLLLTYSILWRLRVLSQLAEITK